jgi:hypothetical protein
VLEGRGSLTSGVIVGVGSARVKLVEQRFSIDIAMLVCDSILSVISVFLRTFVWKVSYGTGSLR